MGFSLKKIAKSVTKAVKKPSTVIKKASNVAVSAAISGGPGGIITAIKESETGKARPISKAVKEGAITAAAELAVVGTIAAAPVIGSGISAAGAKVGALGTAVKGISFGKLGGAVGSLGNLGKIAQSAFNIGKGFLTKKDGSTEAPEAADGADADQVEGFNEAASQQPWSKWGRNVGTILQGGARDFGSLVRDSAIEGINRERESVGQKVVDATDRISTVIERGDSPPSIVNVQPSNGGGSSGPSDFMPLAIAAVVGVGLFIFAKK